MSFAVVPGDQGRSWLHYWRQVETELAGLQRPLPGGVSAKAIADAERRLLAYFVFAYHLKDYIKRTAPAVVGDVESEINKRPALCLLADLANLTKHSELHSKPRSGSKPVVGARSGSSTPGGWRLNLVIWHGGLEHEGLDLAVEAVSAWRDLLQHAGAA